MSADVISAIMVPFDTHGYKISVSYSFPSVSGRYQTHFYFFNPHRDNMWFMLTY